MDMCRAMQSHKPLAVPRVVVWAGLAGFTLYSGVSLLAGPGRDIAFRDLTWTPAAVAQVVSLTILIAGLFGLAAYLTYRHEVAAPPVGTFRIRGARLGAFGELFFTLVGGLLLLAAAYSVLRIPEAILAGHAPQYRSYESASPVPQIVFAAICLPSGFSLMVLRRYVWEFRPGQPARRYWSLAFARGHVATQPLRVYWDVWTVKRGYSVIPVAHWLRVEDPASKGVWRDGDLALLPLESQPEYLRVFEDGWRQQLVAHGAQLAPRDRPVPNSDARQPNLVALAAQ
jgi:hypothetical protein